MLANVGKTCCEVFGRYNKTSRIVPIFIFVLVVFDKRLDCRDIHFVDGLFDVVIFVVGKNILERIKLNFGIFLDFF